jgi:glutathione S-transferase
MSPITRQRPVLYSFRRCPYAIRARLALAAAGLLPKRDLELREVALKAKPPELRAASAKATVPVLIGADGTVLDESRSIMQWALEQHDPDGLWAGRTDTERHTINALIAHNDGPFKHHLDRFKYADRDGAEGLAQQPHHRQAALAILRQWNTRLAPGAAWLLGECPSLADMALLPFVRQFRLADPQGFDNAPDLAGVQQWLGRFLHSPGLAAVLDEPWAERSPWRSPSWLYHLALSSEWQQARSEGHYSRSTRGRTLSEVGFMHLSQAHQVEATAARFYNDLPAGAVTLLVIEPALLTAELRLEPAPDSGELFPHLYGSLPLHAVVHTERWRTEP